MATTKKTAAKAAPKTAAAKAPAATEAPKQEQASSSSEPQGETKAAAEQEQRVGKTVTSVSAGPLAVPTAEAAGAGADRAASTYILQEKDGVVHAGSGLTNQDAELDGSMSVEDFLTAAAIGTTISKTGGGIQITTPVGGGQNRVFAGESFEKAKEEMDNFHAGSPSMLKPLTPPGEDEGDEGEE